ncbi:B3 domain-containing transcription factor VAL3-like isoform X2 [Carica papaya]|uniref:B3 domain-containing transcription factor VAL3-like isoform X2 n=1 Tax=Carica papaya TaxID=3649 RepID=UPI000B8CCC51|nr:B3 domain-containing transcription factor VAL3-like isoform X2 [Carica papaya]
MADRSDVSSSETKLSSAMSSSETKFCDYCKSLAPRLYLGWEIRDGSFCMLCAECACAYDTGNFCKTFHKDASGWRECAFCKTPIHCGCIMSAYMCNVLDFGGVACMSCAPPEPEKVVWVKICKVWYLLKKVT